MSVRALAGGATANEFQTDLLDLDAYLGRVGYRGSVEPTPVVLRELHRAHVSAIVFENLDILLGHGIALDLGSIQDKLVLRGRGGYCHEHNLLFAAVLDRLGFGVTRLLARARDDGRVLLPRGHATLLVETGGQTWLADVGFGCEGLLEPLPLNDGPSVHQGAWAFRLERRGDEWLLRTNGADTSVLYSFAPGVFREPDFEAANYFVSTHASSPFATQLIVQRATPQARYCLRGLELVITIANGQRAQRRVAARDLRTVLANTFALAITEPQAERLAQLAANR